MKLVYSNKYYLILLFAGVTKLSKEKANITELKDTRKKQIHS